MINLIKKIDTNLLIFLSIFSVIFITIGNHITKYKTLIILELFLIFIMLKKDNLYLKFKDLITSKNSNVALIILFQISITISFIFSPLQIDHFSIETSGTRYLFTTSNILLFCTFFLYFNSNKINYSYLFYSIIVPGLIYSFYIFFIWIQNNEISSFYENLLFFSNIRQIGLYLTFVTCFCLGYWVNDVKNIDEKTIIFCLLIFLTITIFLGGRGSFISIILSFIFFLIVLKIKKINIYKKIIFFSLCLFFAYFLKEILYFLGDLIAPKNKYDDAPFRLFRIGVDSSVTDRLALWSYGLDIIKKYPIFGLGSNGFFIESINEKYATGYPIFHNYEQPHNFIIQFLVEWGFLGSLIIFFLIGNLLLKTLKNIFKNKTKLFLIPMISFLGPTCHGLIDGNFYHPVPFFFIILSLSLLAVEIKKNN